MAARGPALRPTGVVGSRAMTLIRGALTALVTPFAKGQIDESALRALVDKQIAAGIHGLVPCGTTGESPTLSHPEHLRVVEIVLDQAAGRVPVVAGAGSNSTNEAIELARGAAEIGVAASLQITPYYNKPTQDGLIAHFSEIASAVDLPMIVYNVPGRTSIDLEAETVAELRARCPAVVGIKEATGDMTRAARIIETCGPDFTLLSGDDFTVFSLLGLGGHGVISVTSNVVPELMAELCNAASAGDWSRARAKHFEQLELCRALFSQSNPIPVKAAMALLGHCEPEIRSPLTPLASDSPEAARVRQVLGELGLDIR